MSSAVSRRAMLQGAMVSGLGLVGGCSGDQRPSPSGRTSVATTTTPTVPPVVDVRDFGIEGLGRSDDSSYFQAALDFAGSTGRELVVPAGFRVGLGYPVSMPPKVTISGGGQIVAVRKLTRLISVPARARRVALRNIALVGHDMVTSALIEAQAGATSLLLEDCSFQQGPIGVYVRDGSAAVTIRRCLFQQLGVGTHIRGAVRSVLISESTFTAWRDRGVWIVGTATAAPRQVRLDANIFDPPAPGGKVRQPVQFNGDDTRLIRDVVVTRNTVRGTGTSYDDKSRPGTADLISLHRCTKFVVADNHVSDGGDVGITVARQSTDGVIRGNVSLRNDSVGICIGSAASRFVSDIVATENICRDNGQDRVSDGKSWARAGILVVRGRGVTLLDNTLVDTGPGTQLAGVSLVESRVRLGHNTISAPVKDVLAAASTITRI